MALVVFLKGINVGGHRKVRPSELARQLKRYEVVSIGAAGTFVVRKPVTQTQLRAELERRLPFTAEIMIVSANDVRRLSELRPFDGVRSDRNIIHFVSVLRKRPRSAIAVPFELPPRGRWVLRVIGRQNRFIYGVYRREMKAISYLTQLDKIFGVAVATRSWSTIESIVRVLGGGQ